MQRAEGSSPFCPLLAAIQHVQNLVVLVREIEPDIDDRMDEGLVNLTEPMRREPIA